MEETKVSKVEQISGWFDKKLSPKMQKLANNRHLLAIRNGIVSTIPFIIVGSIGYLMLNIPISNEVVDGGNNYLGDILPIEINHFCLAIYRYSMGAMGLYAAFGISAYLGRHYGFNQILCGMMGIFAYLLWFDYSTLTINAFGGATIFSAMVSAIAAVEIYRFCVRFNVTIKMPKQVPEAIADSFRIIIPIGIIAILFGGSRYIIGFDINAFLTVAMQPLQEFFTNGFGGVIFLIIFVHFFWAFGIHGTSIIGAVVRPFWTLAIASNADWAMGVDGAVYYQFPEQFLQWGVYIGGAGATLGLIICGLLFSKSAQGKAISTASFVPGLFNINEPAIFGYPIMLNPILMIPFFITPLILAPVAQLLVMMFGIHWTAVAPWTLPAPIGAVFSAGAHWQAMFIPIVTLALAVLIYFPFYLKWDRDTYKAELAMEEMEKAAKEASEATGEKVEEEKTSETKEEVKEEKSATKAKEEKTVAEKENTLEKKTKKEKAAT